MSSSSSAGWQPVCARCILSRAPADTIGHLPYARHRASTRTFAGGHLSPEPDLPRTDLALALAFLAVVAGGVTDLILDAPTRWVTPHVLVEIVLVTVSFGIACYLWWGWHQMARALGEARAALVTRGAERDRWHESARKLLDDLGRAIDQQFTIWGLTPAERAVAFLLLQGLSHKEVAARSGRSERTVRQHAVAVYRKAGIGGRAELAAFFLGALTLPPSSGRPDPLDATPPEEI